jgi:hypothetical protein
VFITPRSSTIWDSNYCRLSNERTNRGSGWYDCPVLPNYIYIYTYIYVVYSLQTSVNIKFTNAKQAAEVHQYKNRRYKSHKTNSAIWFNKMCMQRQVTHKCVSIRINGFNRQCQDTLKKATQIRIKEELEFLYVKKQKLNKRLYKLHLNCAKLWRNNWVYIQSTIDDKLQNHMDRQ